MDNQIKPCDSDFLSQSYNSGIERIVGLKNNTEFKVSKEVIKRREQFWDDLCTTYSKPFSSDIEYNIATLQRCKSLNFVQYWINTSYLPYQALVEEASDLESDMSFTEEESLNSSLRNNVKEKPNEYHARLSYDESSLSSSIDTTAYILSNANTTNKVETMAILEGAKRNASPNQKHCGSVETVQFQKTMLDNNGNAYRAALPTTPSKLPESLTQQTTNNLHKTIIKVPTNSVNRDDTLNSNSEHDEELFSAEATRTFNASRKFSNSMYVRQRSMVDESSTLEDNTTKLSSRKKLYCGRDSPVDLVDTTSRNKIVPINSTENLHPALHPARKTLTKYALHRKRQRNRFSVFHTSMLNRSILSISSYKKRKRKKIARSHVSENSSIMDSSKKRRIPVADKTANNPTNKSFMEPPSSKELLSTESKLDNSVAQVEKFVNRFSEKSNHASRTYLNPIIYLRPVTERDIQKYRSSNKTTSSPSVCPVVHLIQLSDSDIEKYRKPKREATRPGSLSPIVHLKQPSEFNNPERRKSQDALNVRFRHPVVRLKKLSEQDIKKYKAEIVRSEYRDVTYVSHNSSKCPNISQPGSKAVHSIGVSDSEESTLLICKCNSSASQKSRQSSSSIVGASENRNLVRKDTSNKYTGPNNSALYKTSETAQNGYCRNFVIDSSSNSSRTVKRRSLWKNLKTSVSSLETSKSVLPEEGVRQNDKAISCSDESEIFNKDYRSNGAHASKNARTKSRSHNIILSDEDDGFLNLIYYPKQRTNSKIKSPYDSPRKNSKIRSPCNSPRKNSEIRSPCNSPRKNSEIRSPCNSPRKNFKIRSPYNSPEKNSDDPVETWNAGKRTTKSMGAQLLSESIGQNTKFKKQTPYFYRKRRSKNLSYLSEEENINRTSPVSITKSRLSPKGAYGYKSNESQVVLRDRRNLLTSMNIKRDKSRLHTLRFQTKVFDSDSESSCFS